MTSYDVIRAELDDGLDRKDLRRLKDRFLAVNGERLARTREALGARRESVLDVIPVFLAANHPMLPGFVSREVPHGLASYQPDDNALRAAQQVARSYKYQPDRLREPDLYSLFLMGSTGTLGQTSSSDLDIWVCHRSGLEPAALALLEQKCERISAWCYSIGVEAHFFLMSPTRFSHGETGNLSTENCGSAQHYLLLDEFYRTAVLLAGRYPIWWLVPPPRDAEHAEHAATLRDKRFIPRDETIDLGGVALIPPGEFVGAGLWQIYKGIDSPYKSVLKILLTEVYASEFPSGQILSARFKELVYGNQLDADVLDPYVLVYEKLEQYLAGRAEWNRLELVRRCLYLKAGVRLSRKQDERHWKVGLMRGLTESWEWDKAQLRVLDDHRNWKAKRVDRERREVVNNLNYSYRFLTRFAREQQSEITINAAEMTVLGRKLYAAFERKADKVEMINPGLAPDLSEDYLTIREYKQCWKIFCDSPSGVDDGKAEPVKQARTLIDALTWCHLNGLLDAGTQLSVGSAGGSLGKYELDRFLEVVRRQLPFPFRLPDQSAFAHPADPLLNLYFINFNADTGAETAELHRVSNRTDALTYSAYRENLAHSIDQVAVNTWHEVYCSHHAGMTAIADSLVSLLRALHARRGRQLPAAEFHCLSSGHGASIARRLQQLYEDVTECYFGGGLPLSTRYLIEVQEGFFSLQFQDGEPVGAHLPSEKALLKHLGADQPHYSPIVVDRNALRNSHLREIFGAGRTESIQVFLQMLPGDEAEVHLLDERGSLYRYRTPCRFLFNVLMPLDRFLRSVRYRLSAATDNAALAEDILYYELRAGEAAGDWSLRSLDVPRDSENAEHHAVQVIVESGENGKAHYSVFCNHIEFSSLEHGDRLFHTVASHIISQRESGGRYPCYITDLDLGNLPAVEGQAPRQTLHYLRYKHHLERLLQHALEAQ